MTNQNIQRLAPRGVKSTSAQTPPFPRLEEHCPDLVSRFPELLKFDEAAKQWVETQKNAVNRT